MQTSPTDKVRNLYEETADSYAQMMDAEIGLPVYADVLRRLSERISNTPGTLVDSACGSGHMLAMYHENFDRKRSLLGVDLSPRMVSIAAEKLGTNARVVVGDMCELSSVEPGSASALLNFFALHHLGPDSAESAFHEWYRVLQPGGQLVVSTWEGHGSIDYGEESDIVALRYSSDELKTWAQKARFTVTRCAVEPVEDFPMDAVYLEAVRE